MATINQVTLTISGNTGGIEFHTRQDGGIWATFDVAQTSRTFSVASTVARGASAGSSAR